MPKQSTNRIAYLCAVMSALGLACTEFVHAAEPGTLYGIKVVDQQLVVRSLDLDSSLFVQERGKLPHQANERINAIFQQKDRSIGVLRTSTRPGSSRRATVRMLGVPGQLIDASGWDVTGLTSSEAISSLLVPMAGPAVGLVAHYSDTAPFSLATVSSGQGQTAAVKTFELDRHARYGHLTQCPSGLIYATSLAQQWDVRIVQIDIPKRTVIPLAGLQVYGKSLHRDVADLACGPSGDLFALADPDYSGVNSLFKINLGTGAMTMVGKYDVDRMTFVR
jgi:hypothetical protein